MSVGPRCASTCSVGSCKEPCLKPPPHGWKDHECKDHVTRLEYRGRIWF